MSDKRNNTDYSPNRIDTLIGAGTHVSGNIECTGVLRVQGEVSGDVSCRRDSDGALIVDGAGSVAGTIEVPRLVVRGRVAGPSHAADSVEVHRGASLIGDVFFREIAIHAGGVLEGTLTPTTAEKSAPTATAELPAPAGARSPTRRSAAIAVSLVVLVGAAAWASVRFVAGDRPAEAAVARQEPAQKKEPPQETLAADRTPNVAAVAPVSSESRTEKKQEDFVTVRGANPNRPKGVFLLVTQDSAVLYKKRRDDAGAGSRIETAAGEKVSVSIAGDELIRVAKGRAVEIFFQGQKVQRALIDNGSWISFVPRSAAGEPQS